ncbi:MAG: endosialidase [Lachnospiraceae bacterium]|nr:endosialidase [Lachnospiraceae bacterium]
MAIIEELIRAEKDNAISFGNHKLDAKTKVENFECAGDLWKVKTYKSITKLEKNGLFAYESVPGTSVNNFVEKENGVSFRVEGDEDAQITVGLEDETEYDVLINGESIGRMKTNLAGKLNLSVELAGSGEVSVQITK